METMIYGAKAFISRACVDSCCKIDKFVSNVTSLLLRRWLYRLIRRVDDRREKLYNPSRVIPGECENGPTSWILLEPRNLHPHDTRFLFEREVKSTLSLVLNQSFHRIVFPRHFHRAYFLLQHFSLFFFHTFSPSKYIQYFIYPTA